MKRKLSVPIIVLAFTINAMSQDTDCEKYFKKEKSSKKKSSMFAEKELVQTDFFHLLDQNSREIFIQFKKIDSTRLIVFRQQTVSSWAFKNPLVLGTAIKIGLKFEDGSTYIVTFQSNQNVDFQNEKVIVSSNETLIDKRLSSLLVSSKVSLVEILNPINGKNQSKTTEEEVGGRQAEKILTAYNCFLLK